MRKTGGELAALTLAAAMALSIAACGEKAETSVDTTAAAATEEATVAGTEAPAPEDQKADIVVIDVGGADMTVAIQAVQDSATNMVVLGKMPITGGSTTRSTGGLNAAATRYQGADGIEDPVDLFVEDTMKGGEDINDREPVTAMAENSAGAADWASEVGDNLSVVGMFGGANVKYVHKPSDTSAVGPMLVKTLNAKMAELSIPILLETTAQRILVDADDKAGGVTAADKDGKKMVIDCTAVVLATGGFGANMDMVVKYKSDLAGFGTTNHAGAIGDNITMAVEGDAALVDMGQIRTHPTVNPDIQTIYTEGVRGNGVILVNKEGLRFINELETRDVVSAAILKQADKQCYMISDQAVRNSLSAIESYVKIGTVTEADMPEALDEVIGVDGDALAETLKTYVNHQANGTNADFGREGMGAPLGQPEYCTALCTPAVHHTVGGVEINISTEVSKEDGTAIPGLFTTGEAAGGVHGVDRLGGNAVTDIAVLDRIVGIAAEKYVTNNGGDTESEITVTADGAAVTPEVEGGYRDGVYKGAGIGNNGNIKVEVTVEGGNIAAVVLKEHGEAEGICEAAEKSMTVEIIKKQIAEVDAVFGITDTSKGIMDTIMDALSTAK